MSTSAWKCPHPERANEPASRLLRARWAEPAPGPRPDGRGRMVSEHVALWTPALPTAPAFSKEPPRDSSSGTHAARSAVGRSAGPQQGGFKKTHVSLKDFLRRKFCHLRIMKSAEPCLPAAQKNCQHHAGRGAKPGRNGYFCYFECEDCAHLVLECLNLDASQHKYRRTKPGKRARAIVLRTLRLPLPNTPGTNFPVSWEKMALLISWAPPAAKKRPPRQALPRIMDRELNRRRFR